MSEFIENGLSDDDQNTLNLIGQPYETGLSFQLSCTQGKRQ